MRISREDWKAFFKLQKGVLALFVFALVSSALYAVYLVKNNGVPNSYLSQYLQGEAGGFTIRYVIMVFIMYFKRCLIIWLMGIFGFMAPICLALVFIYIFSYGFSITWLFISLGMRGIGKGIMSFGVQGVLIVGFLLCLSTAIIERNQVFSEEVKISYPFYLLVGAAVCMAAAVIECLLMI